MVSKKKYTTNIHANRLRMMMRRGDWYFFCPAGRYFDPGSAPTEIWDVKRVLGVVSEPCQVCRTFIGIPIDVSCPCIALGHEEALKKTKKALQKHYA